MTNNLKEKYQEIINNFSNPKIYQNPELLKNLIQEKKEIERKMAIEQGRGRDKGGAIILEITPGTGGGEAEIYALDLLRMYLKFMEKKGWKKEILNIQKTSINGLKEAVVLVQGDGVFDILKDEAGVHRVQRIPVTEKSGRIHTSTAAVTILPQSQVEEIKISPQELKIETFRSSGHGGQSVNTTDSAVRITHLPTGLTISCQDERSQFKNREKALKVLKTKLLKLKTEGEHQHKTALKKKQTGSRERAEKIRTYNFPQNRITDHLSQKTIKNLKAVLDGDLGLLKNDHSPKTS